MCQACEVNRVCEVEGNGEVFRLRLKFREICAVFHLAQPWRQTFLSILLVGQRYVVQLNLQALIVIQ